MEYIPNDKAGGKNAGVPVHSFEILHEMHKATTKETPPPSRGRRRTWGMRSGLLLLCVGGLIVGLLHPLLSFAESLSTVPYHSRPIAKATTSSTPGGRPQEAGHPSNPTSTPPLVSATATTTSPAATSPSIAATATPTAPPAATPPNPGGTTVSPPTTTPTPAGPTQRMGVVSYFLPGALWNAVDAQSPTVGIALINPNSGPGAAKDVGYAAQVARTQSSGISVLGYVDTSYGKRALADVEGDITHYFAWYPTLGGIFLDQAATDCGNASAYYQPLYMFIKAHSSQATVVINPGVPTAECYMNVADIVVECDNDYANYASWSSGGWEASYPADRFWHIIHDASAAQMQAAVALGKQRNVGWMYITDKSLPNPFDQLPSYWQQELGLLAG